MKNKILSYAHIKDMEQWERKNRNEKSVLRGLLVLFLMCGASLVLELLIFNRLSIDFVKKYRAPIVFLMCLGTVVLLSAGIIFLIKGKERIYRTLLSAFTLLLFFLIILGVAEWTDFITVLQSRDLYEQFLQRAGAYMPYIYILLQIIQVLFLPIPGVFSMVVGIKLFGAFLASVYSFVGIALGSMIAFFIGKRYGNKAVAWIIGAETLESWKKRMHGKDHLILTAMFLLPFFPDDILCFVAGVSTMSVKYFTVMILLTRAVSVFTTCYSVELIPFDTWWGLLVWAVIVLSIAVAFIILYKNLDKINAYLRSKHK